MVKVTQNFLSSTHCWASTSCDAKIMTHRATATTAQFLQAAAITIYSCYCNCMKTESTATDVAFRVSSYYRMVYIYMYMPCVHTIIETGNDHSATTFAKLQNIWLLAQGNYVTCHTIKVTYL